MPKLSQAKIDANVRYNRKQDAIMIRPPRDVGQMIRDAASDAGVPLQRWIIDTLMDRIAQDQKGRD